MEQEARKYQAASAFMAFQGSTKTEAGEKLATLCIDRGGEFTARTFLEYCEREGVRCHLTAPYSPQQNRVVEWRSQTVLGMTRSKMKAMSLPSWFWGEATLTAVFLLNRSVTQSMDGRTPYEVWQYTSFVRLVVWPM
jgi:transposase InsO family protein